MRGGRARSHFLSLPSRPLPLSFSSHLGPAFALLLHSNQPNRLLCGCSMHNSRHRVDPGRQAKVFIYVAKTWLGSVGDPTHISSCANLSPHFLEEFRKN